MSEIQEQTELAAEIQDQISSGPIGADLDEVRQLQEPGYVWNAHSSFTGRAAEGVGGSRTRQAERDVAGRGACTNAHTARRGEDSRGWVHSCVRHYP